MMQSPKTIILKIESEELIQALTRLASVLEAGNQVERGRRVLAESPEFAAGRADNAALEELAAKFSMSVEENGVYTIEQLSRACSKLAEMGKLTEVQELFGSYEIDNLMALPSQCYAAFAEKLREKGAKF